MGTSKPLKPVKEALASVTPTIFAHHGSVATKQVTVEAGTEALKAFPPSSEPHLRKLGLPTLLKDGVIHLLGNYTVCDVGDELSREQASLLKLLEEPMVQFTVDIVAKWSRQTRD